MNSSKLLLIGLLLLCGCKENEEWEKFKEQHHCKIVAHIDSTFSYGRGVVINSPQDGWLCDDGITYFKVHEND